MRSKQYNSGSWTGIGDISNTLDEYSISSDDGWLSALTSYEHIAVPKKKKKDKITFEIDPYCKKHDPGMYYMLLAYLYKHIENFEAIVKQDDDFRQYRIKTKVTESDGEFQFTVFYDKDITKG